MNWVSKISLEGQKREFTQKYKIEEVAELIEDCILSLLMEQELNFLNEGWDDRAFISYINYIIGCMKTSSCTIGTILKEVNQAVYLVGSPVYLAMFRASDQTDREKIRLLLKQMGAYLDKNEMLQLTDIYIIDPNLPPHTVFWELVADCVKNGYPEGLIAAAYPELDKMELKMIHQFRYFIDRQNIYYIRANFNGKTDYEKLSAYAEKSGQRLIYSDTSRFHNRVRFSQSLLKNGSKHEKRLNRQANDKIKTQNGLSEFIVNVVDGHFVSQWNQLKTVTGQQVYIEQAGVTIGINNERINSNPKDYDLIGETGKEIADTESFNYDRGFLDWLPWRRRHDRYDMKPSGQEKFDSNIRKLAKRNWPFPKLYREIYRNANDVQRQLK